MRCIVCGEEIEGPYVEKPWGMVHKRDECRNKYSTKLCRVPDGYAERKEQVEARSKKKKKYDAMESAGKASQSASV